MMEENKLSHLEQDVLREIGNIGAGNATTSLSKLINKEIHMEVPAVNLVTFNEMVEEVGGPEKLIVTIMFKIEGEMTGTVFFVLTLEEANLMVEQMTGAPQLDLMQGGTINEMAASALKESANILTGSYLSALADLTSLHIQPTIPFLNVDMAAATLISGMVDISQETDYALIIDTKMAGADTERSVRGHFLLIPDPTSVPILLKALGVFGK